MDWKLSFPGTFVLKSIFVRSIRSLELSFPVMPVTLIYDIRLDCTLCYILMIYSC